MIIRIYPDQFKAYIREKPYKRLSLVVIATLVTLILVKEDTITYAVMAFFISLSLTYFYFIFKHKSKEEKIALFIICGILLLVLAVAN